MPPSRPRAFWTRRGERFSPIWRGPRTRGWRTSSREATPSCRKVVAGSHVVFAVDVQGIRPRNVLLHFSVDGGKFFAVREFSAGRNLYDPWQVTYTNAQQSMEYYLTGGDAESERYHLEVLPAPTITSISHDLDVPDAYTKLEPRKGIEGGTFRRSKGPRSPFTPRPTCRRRPRRSIFRGQTLRQMDVDAQDSTILTGTFDVPPAEKRGSYTIKFRTTGGQLNPSPVTYDIDSIPDRPPTARFVQPDKPAIKVPANVKVDLVATGNDDHGVKSANLVVLAGDRTSDHQGPARGPGTQARVQGRRDARPGKARPEAGLFSPLQAERLRQQGTVAQQDGDRPSSSSNSSSRCRRRKRRSSKTLRRTCDRPEPSSTRDEEPSQEQPPQEGPANAERADQPQPAGRRRARKAATQTSQMRRPRSGRIPGSERGTREPKRTLAAARIKTSSPPRKNRKSATAWTARRQEPAKNRRTKTGNPPGSQPEDRQRAGRDRTSRIRPRRRTRTIERKMGQSPKSSDAKQPGKMQKSDQNQPAGGPPQEGSNGANDPTNKVKRADQSNNPAASRATHEERPAEGRAGKERAAGPTPVPTNPAAIPNRKGQKTPANRNRASNPRTSRAIRESKRIETASPPSRKNADSSGNAQELEKMTGKSPTRRPTQTETPDAKDESGRQGKSGHEVRSPTTKDSPETKGNPDNNDMRKDASAREQARTHQPGRTANRVRTNPTAARTRRLRAKTVKMTPRPRTANAGRNSQGRHAQGRQTRVRQPVKGRPAEVGRCRR